MIARTILIIKLNRPQTRPLFPLSNLLLDLAPQLSTWHPTHLALQTRNSSITLGTLTLPVSCNRPSPVHASSSGALEFTYLFHCCYHLCPGSRHLPPRLLHHLATGLPAHAPNSFCASQQVKHKSVHANLYLSLSQIHHWLLTTFRSNWLPWEFTGGSSG